MKQTTKFPAFFKLIIQNILHLEAKYYYLHLKQKFWAIRHDPRQSMI